MITTRTIWRTVDKVPAKPLDKKAAKPASRSRATGERPTGRGVVLA